MVVGVAGGIAAGKSTFCEVLHDLKLNSILLLTDDIAKEQQKIGGVSYQGIVDYFGVRVLNEDGTINSNELGKIVFADKKELQKLNEITHPNVLRYVENVIENNKDKFIIIESALLFDCALKDMCDVTIFVTVSEKERIRRMRDIRHYSDEKIKNVLDKQKAIVEKLKKDTIIVDNSGNLSDLKEQCLFILDSIA